MSQQPLAYLSAQFLESEEARPIRILSEYLERRLPDGALVYQDICRGRLRSDAQRDWRNAGIGVTPADGSDQEDGPDRQ